MVPFSLNMKKFIFVILSCMLVLTGCAYQKEIDELQSQIAVLQGEISSLKEQSTKNDSPEPPGTEDSHPESSVSPTVFNRYSTAYGDLIQYQGVPALPPEELIHQVKSAVVSIKIDSFSGIDTNCSGAVLLHNQNTTLILISALHLEQADQIFVILEEESQTRELPVVLLKHDQEANIAILQAEEIIGTPIALGTASNIQRGQYLYNCSYDANFFPVVCEGIVISITEEIYSTWPEIGKIRGTAAFSEDGLVIGFFLDSSSKMISVDSVIQVISNLLNS